MFMNKYIILTFFALIVFNKKPFAQGDTCGTETFTEEFMSKLPWYGNNDYLHFYADSIGLFDVHRSIESSNLIPESFVQSKFKIPIQFWVYRDSEGNDNGINERKVQELLDDLNYYFLVDNYTRTYFYSTCQIKYIDDDQYISVEKDSQEEEDIVKNNYVQGVLNVHLISTYEGLAGKLKNLSSHSAILLEVNFDLSPSTFPHEVGHFFGLPHTHRNAQTNRVCSEESVSRDRNISFWSCGCITNCRNCEKKGDAFCYTPADPNLEWGQYRVQGSCDFNMNSNVQDVWGDYFYENPPLTDNIMSYIIPRTCRNKFTV